LNSTINSVEVNKIGQIGGPWLCPAKQARMAGEVIPLRGRLKKI
jgi:hypothetical protein